MNNKRLWVFHHLQGAGKCDEIPVIKVKYDSGEHDRYFTTQNGGVSITIKEGKNPYARHRPIPVTPFHREQNDENCSSDSN